jgi:hypothetical protein
LTIISLANSIPGDAKPSFKIAARSNPRNPQWKSPSGDRNNNRPIKLSTGLPK